MRRSAAETSPTEASVPRAWPASDVEPDGTAWVAALDPRLAYRRCGRGSATTMECCAKFPDSRSMAHGQCAARSDGSSDEPTRDLLPFAQRQRQTRATASSRRDPPIRLYDIEQRRGALAKHFGDVCQGLSSLPPSPNFRLERRRQRRTSTHMQPSSSIHLG